jgi:glyoxylase-like metal-dependent hydrolase (beta-lactamase superfamily II)
MLIRRVIAPALEVNTYVLAAAPGGPCVVVDPGGGSAERLPAVLEDLDLTVGAVLVTHGHPDHLWDSADVADAADVVVQVAAPDLDRLDDPAAARHVGEILGGQFALIAGSPWRAPSRSDAIPAPVLAGGGAQVVPGVVARGIPAPGHTAGSTVLLVGATTGGAGIDAGAPGDPGHLPLPAAEPGAPVVLTGDVVFAGSVGRTDFPGGDPQAMTETLRTLRQVLSPASILLPGPGPATTMARELASNPFLR